MVLVPHADKVVPNKETAFCKGCQAHLSNPEHYLGYSSDPVPHVAWMCKDCDYIVAELVEK